MLRSSIDKWGKEIWSLEMSGTHGLLVRGDVTSVPNLSDVHAL